MSDDPQQEYFSDGMTGEMIAQLEKGILVLQTISKIAPLIGLFGTVTGMIRSFQAMGAAGGESPRIVAAGIAEDFAAFRALRVSVHAGQLHGLGIGQAHVPVEPVDEDRVVGRDLINQLSGRQLRRVPVFVIPVAVQQPDLLLQSHLAEQRLRLALDFSAC